MVSPPNSLQIRGKPPTPSNRLAIVAGRPNCLYSLLSTHLQGGSAIEFPIALYRPVFALSLCPFPFEPVHSPMSVQLSGNPCSLSHSSGVSRRMNLSLPGFTSITAIGSCMQFNVRHTSGVRCVALAACQFPTQTGRNKSGIWFPPVPMRAWSVGTR